MNSRMSLAAPQDTGRTLAGVLAVQHYWDLPDGVLQPQNGGDPDIGRETRRAGPVDDRSVYC